MQRVLAVAAAALLLASVASLTIVGDDGAEPRSNGGSETTTTASTVPPPLAPGRARVTGLLVTATANDASSDAVAPPFTITVPAAGGGGMRIPSVLVDGQEQIVEWGGGAPLPVSGRGAGLDVDPTSLTMNGTGITWQLDRATRLFLPGTYELGSTVAAGTGGILAARDRLKITAAAPDGAAMATFGGAVVSVAARPLRFESANGTLDLAGQLTIETTSVTRPLPSLRFGPGKYVVELTPVAGGYTILATLDGKLTG